MAIGLTWLSFEMSPSTPIWRLLLPFAVIGVGSAFVWSPLTATATRNLPADLAGAGSAVYNSTRQLGAVLGSAGMAAFMTWRIGAEMPSPAPSAEDTTALQLPAFLRAPFAAAMAQSVLLPAFIVLFGIVAALFVLGFVPSARTGRDLPDDGDVVDDGYDDDDYVEFVLVREPAAKPPPRPEPRAGPTGFAYNGSHVDGGKRLRPMASPGRRYRPDPDDDPTGYGRHSPGG